MNFDNLIDVLDILIIMNCIMDLDCDNCSDYNEDGNSDILDIMLVNIILDI